MDIQNIELLSIDKKSFVIRSTPSITKLTDSELIGGVKRGTNGTFLQDIDIIITSIGYKRTVKAEITMKYVISVSDNYSHPKSDEDFLKIADLIQISYAHARIEFKTMCEGTEFENEFLKIIPIYDIFFKLKSGNMKFFN